jgi:hypothetical protein
VTTLVAVAVMLGAGLLARHVTVHAGRAIAARTRLRVPSLCGYALAGCAAGTLKLVLLEWTALAPLAVWAVFGAAWGIVAGLVLPLSRRPAHPE